MKITTIIAAMLLTATCAMAQTTFRYEGKAMTSGPGCLYVNSAKKTNAKKYTFATVNEALLFAKRKPANAEWTEIYIEPDVYWIDNPDDPKIAQPNPGSNTPYGLEVALNHTRIIGLSSNPEDVVLACRRGQTQGANGNFTMLHITGSNNEVRNITFGNYCNVDLIYPRNPKRNRAKRNSAIVQAQLVICRGDDYSITNCRFISRLNLCPFVGPEHIDFTDCYFECTDDALCGTGTYRHCSFTLFSSKPFYSTYKQGAHFIDCDLHAKTHGTQYLTKVSGPVRMERCRWTSDDPDLRIEWDRRPDPRNHCVMTDCTLNGKPLDVPTPTEPLPVELPAVAIANQPDIIPGQWTIDCYKPADTAEFPWTADNSRPAWGYAEGVDGAEGSWGMVQQQKGARLMFTPKISDNGNKQTCIVTLDPCKGPGQGFGSATGQYLDICIKFDTSTLTGYGIRFIRTPDYDKSVDTYLVEYTGGTITRISEPKRCDLFRKGCRVELNAVDDNITVCIANDAVSPTPLVHTAKMANPSLCKGFHLQHTGSTGASATVIKSIFLK